MFFVLFFVVARVPYKVKEVVPLGGPVLVEFIDGILSPKHNPN